MKINFFPAILLGVSLFWSQTGWTLEVKMHCHDKFYRCYEVEDAPARCLWTTAMGQERFLELTADPSYPNPNYPHEVWRGSMTRTDDERSVEVKVKYNSNPEFGGISSQITLSTNEGAVVGKGGSYVDVARHNGKFGHGYLCWGIEVVDQ